MARFRKIICIIEIMDIKENVSLSEHSTMGLGGTARYLSCINSKEDIEQLIPWAKDKGLNFIVIGSGSNIVWKDEGYDGLIIVNQIKGFEVYEDNLDHSLVRIAAGEIWDEVVDKACLLGLSGIECLSLIPGTTGATPVQNVGAYGQEIADSIISIEVYDTRINEFIEMHTEVCDFTYRNSIFKDNPGDYIICNISLKLEKRCLAPPFYSSLSKHLDENNISDYSPNSIRNAVIAIRNSKLPDPKFVKNCGSFFGNPIIGKSELEKILLEYPELSYWQLDEMNFKVSAAWLVEKLGLKGFKDTQTGMSIWDKQALVLVNETAKSTEDLIKFRDNIVTRVKEAYGISLVQEPLLLP